ncbi:MAG TPA: prolyl oligopeptidase family serine peptidase, partial [Pyrinomonadaceae bacterium]|nr:prolyl oligopeptidase family serine peptidase [Pyrinomonadaceae bacterium]
TLSPDGNYLAFVLQRRKATAKLFKQEYLWGNDRADVWLVSTRSGSPKNLTHGAEDGSGFWGPLWSPDGRYLAMLSTRGGNVRLYVWQKASGQLKRLTDRGINIWSSISVPYVWISNTKIVCPVLPEGLKPRQMIVEMQAAQTAIQEWPKAWKGQQSTASVLESGILVPLDRRKQGQLLLVDVITGKQQLITTGNCRTVLTSPDNRHVAFLRQAEVPLPNPEGLFTTRAILENGYELQISTSDGHLVSTGSSRIRDVQFMQWSPDGNELAAVGYLKQNAQLDPALFVFNLATRTIQPIAAGDLRPSAIEWSNRGQLLILAKDKRNSGKSEKENRLDWWLIEGEGHYRNLTSSLPVVPAQLIPEASGTFVGLASGALWRIPTDIGNPQSITSNFGPRTSIIWPNKSQGRELKLTHLILAGKTKASVDLYQIDLSSGQSIAINKPAPEASLIAFAPQNNSAVFIARTRNGTSLWISNKGFQQTLRVLETNRFLRNVDQGEVRQIAYQSLDGKDLTAQLILPINYHPGKRYPLITWVYAGITYGDEPPSNTNLSNASSLNLQLLAARGFAVLLPSMPLGREGEASDPYFELTKGVLPAIDKVIELGIADENRLGVMGASFGGYTVYGLISQTNRFKVAVAFSGISDLISLYGMFDARYRYTDFPHEYLTQVELSESGQMRMGGPPWKDFQRYLRNSPLFYVDRIETPLMIIQGDMDYVSIQQGEQMFTSLYRRNKRASFVRYWGEGHVLESPANVNDMWKRIYVWFDEFLTAPESLK